MVEGLLATTLASTPAERAQSFSSTLEMGRHHVGYTTVQAFGKVFALSSTTSLTTCS